MLPAFDDLVLQNLLEEDTRIKSARSKREIEDACLSFKSPDLAFT
jgi:hypothetical protein